MDFFVVLSMLSQCWIKWKDLLYKMSEDAKEKGNGKQALRKKKGKKVTRKLL